MTEATLPSHPLSPDLTQRVLRYLAVFRLMAVSGLVLLWYGNLSQLTDLSPSQALAATTLAVYGAFAVWISVLVWRARHDPHLLARMSVYGDTYLLSLLIVLLGGPESGLSVLMIFTAAMAAVLLPVRIALFLAAVLSLAVIFAAILQEWATSEPQALLEAGLFGVSVFAIALLAHFMAVWVRDYRLTAERHEARAGRLEQISELIIRRMRTGVLALDADCNIQMHNESAWFLLGSPPPDRRNLKDIAPELHETIEEFVLRGIEPENNLTLSATQAEVVPRLVSLPVDSEIRMLVFLEDNDVVTQRALEHSSATLAQLSGSIAHEIRNPLSAVTNAAQLLAESEAIDPADVRLVEIIGDQSRRMNRIVENILQLSRREKSRVEIVELEPMLEDLVGEFAANHEEVQTRLEVQNPDSITAVVFDRSQLWQVVMKLMDNASDHAGADKKKPSVTLSMSKDERAGYVVVTVADNGPGIPAESMQRIFEPFFTTRKQGSGLGLYIARQLCEANQAELTVDSEAGEGTRFHIRLPLTRGHGNAASTTPPHKQETA